MDELYTRFAKLPLAVQQTVTSPEALDALELLEDRYRIPLAETLMRVLVGDVRRGNLEALFVRQFGLAADAAAALAATLRDTLLQEPQSSPAASDQHPATAPATLPSTPSSNASAAQPRFVGARMQQRPPAPPQRVPVPPPNLPVEAMTHAAQRAPSKPPAVPPQRTPVRQATAGVPAARATQAGRSERNVTAAPPMNRPAPPVPKPAAAPPPSRPLPAAPRVPQGEPRPTARFYFHPDDETDIRQHAAHLTHAHGVSTNQESPDEALVRSLQEQHQVALGDPQLQQRFRLAVLSRLRGIRDAGAFQELLQRSVAAGGLGLAPAAASRLTGQIGAAASAQQTGRQDAGVSTGTAQPEHLQQPPIVPAAVRAAARGMHRQPSSPPAIPHAASLPVQKPALPLPPPIPPPAPAAPSPRPRLRRDAQEDETGRPVIRDIRRPAVPTGPVEELSAYLPDDLRAPGTDAQHVVSQIAEKIRLLAEESFELRAHGIAAWRRSPLFQLYMDIGRESMATGVTMEEVLANRRRAGRPALTEQEFLYVADLNRQLTA